MTLLKTELNLPNKAIQLLEAVGHADADNLANADPVALREAFVKANEEHQLYKKLPGLKQIEAWIAAARLLSHHTSESPSASLTASDEDLLVNFENDPDVVEMIGLAPLALPLPGKLLAAKQVPVQEIPVAVLLTAARGDVSIRVGTKSPEKRQEKTVIKTPASSGSYVNTISFGQKKEEVNLSRIRSTDEFTDPNKQRQEREEQKTRHEERLRLLRTALPETNSGINRQSRRYVRGVLHTHPWQVWWGALIALACHLIVPLGILAAFALLLKDNGSRLFAWVPGWFLAFPLGVFVFGVLYFIISYPATCRICGQRCFAPKKCLKSDKAHHLPIVGYVFSVALHIILFRWFRCSFCGTPVRLKP